jgi:hypothetical protein
MRVVFEMVTDLPALRIFEKSLECLEYRITRQLRRRARDNRDQPEYTPPRQAFTATEIPTISARM